VVDYVCFWPKADIEQGQTRLFALKGAYGLGVSVMKSNEAGPH